MLSARFHGGSIRSRRVAGIPSQSKTVRGIMILCLEPLNACLISDDGLNAAFGDTSAAPATFPERALRPLSVSATNQVETQRRRRR